MQLQQNKPSHDYASETQNSFEPCRASVPEAETLTLLESLQTAHAEGFQRVICYRDSKTLVSAINSLTSCCLNLEKLYLNNTIKVDQSNILKKSSYVP